MNRCYASLKPLVLFFVLSQVWGILGAIPDNPNGSLQPPLNESRDPLVNQQWATITHIAAIILAVCLIAIVGILSKKVEHAISAALILSLLLIGFFFLIGL